MSDHTYEIFQKDHKNPIATVEDGKLITKDKILQKVWNSKPKLRSGGHHGEFLFSEEKIPKTTEEKVDAFVEALAELGIITKQIKKTSR